MRAHFEKQQEEEIIWFVFPRPSAMMNDLFTEFHVLLYIKLPSVKMDWIDKISSYSIRQKKTLQRDRMCITKCILSSFFDNGNCADDNRSHHNRIPGISPMASADEILLSCGREMIAHRCIRPSRVSVVTFSSIFPKFPFHAVRSLKPPVFSWGGRRKFFVLIFVYRKMKKKRRDTRTPSNNVFL